MSGPDFERMSVLIVDDSELIVSIVSSVLSAIGFEKIFSAADGLEAVEFIQLVESKPVQAGTSQVDLVIVDLLMPRLDGHLLMRWLRMHPSSPDRFLPIMVITGAADLKRVSLARDLGSNEIMSKPFSAKMLGDKLLHIINHPRQFVLAQGYFGPDRRRSERPVKSERRQTTEDEIQIVNADDGTKKFHSDAKVIHFRLRNRLKDKVSFGLEVPPFDPVLLQKAEERIQEFAGDYADWVAESIQTLQQVVGDLMAGRGDNVENMRKINHLSLDFGSQGGIFNYPLVTRLGKSLYAVTVDHKSHAEDGKYHELLKTHVDAISAVISRKISGDGGQTGRDIIAALQLTMKKFGAPMAMPVG